MSSKKRKKLIIGNKEYEGSGHVRIYVDHQQICKYMLKQINDNKIESYQYLIPPMVFTALTLEAYLNHLGNILFSETWEKIERGTSTLAKLLLISEKINYSPNFSSRPFQSFTSIFAYRNLIVHGKTEVVDTPIANPKNKLMPVKFLVKWEKMTTITNANMFYDDMVRIIESLHKHQQIDPLPAFGVRGTTSWVTRNV